jgi:hypothetical protein
VKALAAGVKCRQPVVDSARMQPLARCLLTAGASALSILVTSAAAAPIETTVTAGNWHGTTWTLRASASRDGSYCMALTVEAHERAGSCGSIRRKGISYMAGSTPRIPAYVVGPVVSSARSVEISFYNRPRIRLRTIVGPRSLSPGTRFFAKVLRCPAKPRRFVARNQYGIVVARIVSPRRLGPTPSC